MHRLAITTMLLIITSSALLADEPTLVPFALDWNRSADSPASVAFLLDKPAGKNGFIRCSQGHLVTPSGKRFRIWGINITATAAIPPKESAAQLADHLARCGINCVRLHFLDRLAPQGLIDAGRSDTQEFDLEQLDRLDYFIATLKDRGIYTNLNLNVGRTYKEGDGVPDYELLGFAKALTYFHPRLIALQKNYARQLLTHRNPYTTKEYRHEPAVAIVEMVNENSLVESWFSDRLLGKNTRRHPGTWTDIPTRYETELTELFNRWLDKQLTPEELFRFRTLCNVAEDNLIPRLRPDDFAKAPPARFHMEARFYMELERQYFADMADYLKSGLQVESLLVGTSDHNHGKSGYPLLASTSQLDIVDGHVYWQHPSYLTDPATGRQTGFKTPNTPMVNDPLHCTVVQLSRSAVADRPYTVSEVNHPFPNEYACEGIPILTAYAALHDWDGLFWYTLAHNHLVGNPPRAIGHFDLGVDSMKMTQVAAGALMFLRGDVRAAEQTVQRSYSREQVYESIRLPWSQAPYFTPGFPLGLPLVHSMRISSFDQAVSPQFDAAPAEPFTSDTDQLRWTGASNNVGVVTIDTDRTQAIVGFVTENSQVTSHLATKLTTRFSAVTLSALDDQSIVSASKLLLTVTARVANTSLQWNSSRTSLDNWGTPPTCIEPVAGTVVLHDLAVADSISAQPLDAAGHPAGDSIPLTANGTNWELPLGTPPTTWYALTVSR